MARGSVASAEQLATDITADRLAPIRAKARTATDRYRLDPFAHLEDGHIYIEDLETLAAVPLEPYDHQIELALEWIDVDYLIKHGHPRWRNLHLDKSRQMGTTWFVCYLAWWAVTYHPLAGIVVSTLVDEIANSGMTTDSFMGRIKFMQEYGLSDGEAGGLPSHLRPQLVFTGGNVPSIRNERMPSAFIVGRGATPNPGRGRKYAWGFIDEVAHLPYGRAAHRSLARAIPEGRFYNSTPFGEDNIFAWLKKAQPRGYRFIRLHWSQHPVYSKGLHIGSEIELREDGTIDVLNVGLRGCGQCEATLQGLVWSADHPVAHRYPGRQTSPWFEEAVIELTDEDVASELEIDYTAALTARVYPKFDERLHVAPVHIPWVEALPTELAFDYGADTTAVVICQDAPREYRVIGEVEINDATPEEVVGAIRAELIAIGMPPMLTTKEWMERTLFAVGDPAGERREQATARPLVSDYRAQGIAINSRPRRIDHTIRSVKRILQNRPKPLVVSARCTKFVDHMKNNRWPTNKDGERKPGAPGPENDRHNHMMRAFAYLITYKWPAPDTQDAIRQAVDHQRGREYVVDRKTGKVDAGLTYDMGL